MNVPATGIIHAGPGSLMRRGGEAMNRNASSRTAARPVNASAIPCRVGSRIRRQSLGQGRESDPGFGTNVTEVLIGNSRNQRNQALDLVIVSSPVALKVGPDCYPCCTGAANLPANTDWSQMFPRTFSGSLRWRFTFHPDSWWQSSQRAWPDFRASDADSINFAGSRRKSCLFSMPGSPETVVVPT